MAPAKQQNQPDGTKQQRNQQRNISEAEKTPGLPSKQRPETPFGANVTEIKLAKAMPGVNEERMANRVMHQYQQQPHAVKENLCAAPELRDPTIPQETHWNVLFLPYVGDCQT